MLLKYAMLKIESAVLVPVDADRATLQRIARRHEFDFTPRPGYLYVRSRAISSRTNDNYDEFPAEEIEKGYKTFIGRPVFVNHNNDNHRRARGVVLDAVLHKDSLADGEKDWWVEVLHEIDARRFPKLAKAVREGRIDRTSMGCDVEHSICSMCGNRATTPAEYCSHIPRLKGKRVLRRNAATGAQEEHLIRETCFGLSFFENSLLVEEPADPTAHMWGIEDHSMAKAASRTISRTASTPEGQGQWRGPEHPDLYDADWRTCGHNDESLRDDGLVQCEDCGAVSLGHGERLVEEWGKDLDGGGLDDQGQGPSKHSVRKTAEWYYHRSQSSGDPIVHPAGQPSRRHLDVGDHVLFESGHSARIKAITPSLLHLEGHAPMHRGPIEGDHSRSIWSSETVDQAGQDVPGASEEQLRYLDQNKQGPTKYSSFAEDWAKVPTDPHDTSQCVSTRANPTYCLWHKADHLETDGEPRGDVDGHGNPVEFGQVPRCDLCDGFHDTLSHYHHTEPEVGAGRREDEGPLNGIPMDGSRHTADRFAEDSPCHCGQPGHTNAEHSAWAQARNAEGTHDAWGRPLKKPYDGHGAWDCNDYDCPEHPQSLYQPGTGMPGWMAEDLKPPEQKAVEREVGKHLHETEPEGGWLLGQQPEGPSKYSSLIQHFAGSDPGHPHNHLFKGHPGGECYCGFGEGDHPHPSAGQWARCETCRQDMSHHLHDQGRYEHLKDQEARPPGSGSSTHLFETLGQPYGEGHPDQETCPHDLGWNAHGQCKRCGYLPPTEDDQECDHPYCQESGFADGWHSRAEHVDPPHLDPNSDQYRDISRAMEGIGGEDANWLLKQQGEGPTKYSALDSRTGAVLPGAAHWCNDCGHVEGLRDKWATERGSCPRCGSRNLGGAHDEPPSWDQHVQRLHGLEDQINEVGGGHGDWLLGHQPTGPSRYSSLTEALQALAGVGEHGEYSVDPQTDDNWARSRMLRSHLIQHHGYTPDSLDRLLEHHQKETGAEPGKEDTLMGRVHDLGQIFERERLTSSLHVQEHGGDLSGPYEGGSGTHPHDHAHPDDPLRVETRDPHWYSYESGPGGTGSDKSPVAYGESWDRSKPPEAWQARPEHHRSWQHHETGYLKDYLHPERTDERPNKMTDKVGHSDEEYGDEQPWQPARDDLEGYPSHLDEDGLRRLEDCPHTYPGDHPARTYPDEGEASRCQTCDQEIHYHATTRPSQVGQTTPRYYQDRGKRYFEKHPTKVLSPVMPHLNALTQHFAEATPRLWPQHPEYRTGDRVLETTPKGNQYPATVHSVDEPTNPDHPGRVWIDDDERMGRDRGPVGVHPSRLSPHPEASAEQMAWHSQQKARNEAGEPYVPEAERNIDPEDRTTVHHLTEHHDFALDPTHRPELNTTIGGHLSPRLFVGDPGTWAEGEHHYRRPYVAEVEVPKGAVHYNQGYLGEGEIMARHFDKARVTRVLPYAEHQREEEEPGYRSEVDTRTWTPEQHTEHLRQHREHLHDEHGWGWNEFNDRHEHVGLGDEDWDDKMPDPSHGYPGTYVRRDREGRPMRQVRSSLALTSSLTGMFVVLAGMHGMPLFEVGDRVVDFRGESPGTVTHVQDSGHPGKSNKITVDCDEGYQSHGYEQAWEHHPDAPQAQRDRAERRRADNQAATDLLSSIEGEHGEDFDWLHKNTSRDWQRGLPKYRVDDIVFRPQARTLGRVTHVHPDMEQGRHSYRVAWGPAGWNDDDPEWRPHNEISMERIPEAHLQHSPYWLEPGSEQHARQQQQEAALWGLHGPSEPPGGSSGQDATVLPFRRHSSGHGHGDSDRWVKCDQGHKHWGANGAAGLLVRHVDDQGTKRYLLQHRAEWTDAGGTWAGPGGAMHQGESPVEAAQRESYEELGGLPHQMTHLLTHTDDHGGWAFHTVCLDSPSRWGSSGGEDAEHETGPGGTRWYTAQEMEDLPLHPGFEKTWNSTLKKKLESQASHHASLAAPDHTPPSRTAPRLASTAAPSRALPSPATPRQITSNGITRTAAESDYCETCNRPITLLEPGGPGGGWQHDASSGGGAGVPHQARPGGSPSPSQDAEEGRGQTGGGEGAEACPGGICGIAGLHLHAARGLERHEVAAEDVQVGDYLDITGKTRVHNTITRKDSVTLAWRLKGSKAPGIRQHQVGEQVKVWRRSAPGKPGKQAAAEERCEECGRPADHIHIDQRSMDIYRAIADAAQTSAEMNQHGHRRVVDTTDPVDLKAHLLEAHDYDESDFWRNSHDEDHPALGRMRDHDRPLSMHEVSQVHDWEHGHGIDNDHPDYDGGMDGHFDDDGGHFHTASRQAAQIDPWQQVCPEGQGNCHHFVPRGPAGGRSQTCRDCGKTEKQLRNGPVNPGGRKQATWIGDHPEEPTLFWRAPKTRRWEVHIDNHMPDRNLRENYGSRPRQTVHLFHEDNLAAPHPLSSDPLPRGGWTVKGRSGVKIDGDVASTVPYGHPDSAASVLHYDGPTAWGSVVGHVPPHVQKQVHRALDEVEKHAENHADLYGQMAEQKDIRDDLRRVPGDMAAEQKAHRMFRNLMNSANETTCPKCDGEGNTEAGPKTCVACDGTGFLKKEGARGPAKLPGGFLNEESDPQDYWAEPAGKADYDPVYAHHGIDGVQHEEGQGPWHVTRHPTTRAYQVVDHQNRLVHSYADAGHPKYELHDHNSERAAYHTATQANQDHGHIPRWHTGDYVHPGSRHQPNSEIEDTGIPRHGEPFHLPGTGRARRKGEPLEDSSHVDPQHVTFHYPAPSFAHSTEDPKVAEYKRRAVEHPAPEVYPPKVVQASSSREHGTTYRRVQHGDPDYDRPGAFHDSSPDDEWHGPYRVIKHPETGRHHVVDNQNRVTSYGGRDGMAEQHQAEIMRDYADGRQASKERAKGLAEKIFGGAMDILDPGGTEESRKTERHTDRLNELGHRYEGGPQHPLHPGRFGADDHDEEGDGEGEPYYEVHDPAGSGYSARDYGGANVHIHHQALPHAVDTFSSDDSESGSILTPGSKAPGFGHDELHQELHNWVHGDPNPDPRYSDDIDPDTGRGYAAGPDHAHANPEIEQWQRRKGYRG